jgi:hypothetical protein
MPLLDQETQVKLSDVYDDTLPAGAVLESPIPANQNLLGDLNGIRSQIRRIIDPQSLAGTADWFVDLATALNGFGLRQFHDKKLALIAPFVAANEFTLGAPAAGVLVSAAMVAGGAGLIAVGPSSAVNGGYIAAAEANFTVAGTLGVGLSTALSGVARVLNAVDVFVDGTNDPPLDGGARVFGLLQVITGTADGTGIAAAASENLQISFAKVNPGTDVLQAVTLPADTYQFQLPYQQSFYNLDRGALLGSGQLPDVIDPGATTPRLAFRHFDMTSAAGANETLNIQTGVFSGTGVASTFATFGAPVLPATAAQFRDDNRVKFWKNGNLQSKGAGKEIQYVSATQVIVRDKLKAGGKPDDLVLECPESY